MARIPDDIERKAKTAYEKSSRGSYYIPIAEAIADERRMCIDRLDAAGLKEAAAVLAFGDRL